MKSSWVVGRGSWVVFVAVCLASCAQRAPQQARDSARSGTSDALSGDARSVQVYTAVQLADVVRALAHDASPGRTFGTRAGMHYVESRRVAPGSAEVHDDWIDVTLVQGGRATLVTGGRVSGSHLVSAGEHRGGTISGGTSAPISAGDFFVIAAGVPHQFVVARGDSIVYLTIKVASSQQH